MQQEEDESFRECSGKRMGLCSGVLSPPSGDWENGGQFHWVGWCAVPPGASSMAPVTAPLHTHTHHWLFSQCWSVIGALVAVYNKIGHIVHML